MTTDLNKLRDIFRQPVIDKWAIKEVHFDENGEPITYKSSDRFNALLEACFILLDEKELQTSKSRSRSLADALHNFKKALADLEH